MLPPMRSAASTICSPASLSVPRTIMSWRRLEMPAVAGVSVRVPILTMTEKATTGAIGFSRTSTVRPFGSLVRVTPSVWAAATDGIRSASSSAPRRIIDWSSPRRCGACGIYSALASGLRPSARRAGNVSARKSFGFPRHEGDAGVVVQGEILAGCVPDLLPSHRAEPLEVAQLVLELAHGLGEAVGGGHAVRCLVRERVLGFRLGHGELALLFRRPLALDARDLLDDAALRLLHVRRFEIGLDIDDAGELQRGVGHADARHDPLAVAQGLGHPRALAARQDGREEVEGEAVRVAEAGRLPAQGQMRLLLRPLDGTSHHALDGTEGRRRRRRIAGPALSPEGAVDHGPHGLRLHWAHDHERHVLGRV